MAKSDEEIRKGIKQAEQSMTDSERNPQAQADIEQLIRRAAQPLSSKPGKRPLAGGYSDMRTHSRKTEDTLGKHSGKSQK